MMTPEEGAALTRIVEAGYQIGESRFSIWGRWTVQATHSNYGTVSQSGQTRLQAIIALRDDIQHWDDWRQPAIDLPRRI